MLQIRRRKIVGYTAVAFLAYIGAGPAFTFVNSERDRQVERKKLELKRLELERQCPRCGTRNQPSSE